MIEMSKLKRLLSLKHQITKIERLQFLEIKSNPILKLLNLNILIFVTGHELKLPIVSEEEMNQLSEDIFIALRGRFRCLILKNCIQFHT